MPEEERKSCYGELSRFTIGDCLTCKDNYDCFVSVMDGEICFIRTSSPVCVECPTNGTVPCGNSEPFIRACNLCKRITNERAGFCSGYAKAQIDNLGCFTCEKLSECEISELMLSNMASDRAYVAEDLNRKISYFRQVRKENPDNEDECFGDFRFDRSVCPECGYHIRCRMESGVIPGNRCKYFMSNLVPKVAANPESEKAVSGMCKLCVFTDYCVSLYINSKESLEKETIIANIFSKPMQVPEIRSALFMLGNFHAKE